MEKQNVKRRLELFVKLHLRATHSLTEREAPHSHVWNIDVGLTGPLSEGRIVSLPELQEAFKAETRKLEGTFLNENSALDPQTRRYPTCESLILYFEEAFRARIAQCGWEQVELTELRVTVVEPDGLEYGTARLRL